MYLNGEGVTADETKAAAWFRLAAEQGYSASQSTLGLLYSTGQGVHKNKITALMWLNISVSNGHPTAKNARDLITFMMDPWEIREAEQLARECIAKNYKGC